MGVLTELRELLVEFERADYGSDQYNAAARSIWNKMTGGERESLEQMLFAATPVWDGDHITKSGRDVCITLGLAARVTHLGDWGYTTATYKGASLFKAVNGDEAMKAGHHRAVERYRALAQKTVAKRATWLRGVRQRLAGVKPLEVLLGGKS